MDNQSLKPNGERLNKYIALHAGLSRREADILIDKNKVTINGESVQLGARVLPNDRVAISGKTINKKDNHTYIALHKPRGFVCSRKQQGRTPTIYSLLPMELHSLKPVGRLDADSSGIILLTDDGDLAFHMTHPKFRKQKEYLVQLDKPLEPLHQQMISDFGIALEDGLSQFLVSREETPVNPELFNKQTPVYLVQMSEGRNRQIRHTFDALGYTVTTLHRITFGPYQLGSLPSKAHQPFSQPS